MAANKYTAFKEILIGIRWSSKFLAISAIVIVGFTELM